MATSKNFYCIADANTFMNQWASLGRVARGERGHTRGRERGGRRVLAGTRSALCTAATRGHGRSFPTSCASLTHTGTCDRRYRSRPTIALPRLAIFVRSQVSGIFVVVAARHTVTPPTCRRSGTDRQCES